MRLVALAAVLGLLCVGGLVSVLRGGDQGPSHPDVWDPRITELVGFVERERGLAFKHPVYVDFLPAEEIARGLRGAVRSPDGDMLRAASLQTAELRALGLISGDVDLLEEHGTLSAEGVVAFYDPTTERITAPDEELGPQQQAVLVHELTHVLQDQYFDLEDLKAKAQAPDTLRALAEGDATRIERRFVAQLPADQQAEVNRANDDDETDYEQATTNVSASLDALQVAPYLLGEGMVNTFADFGGQEGIDATFRHPPVSDEALIDPSNYRGNGSIVAVQQPTVVAGETVLDRGTLGPLELYLMLAEATDTSTALNGAYGWGGDAYALVQNGEQYCMRIAYRGDTAADLAEMHTAMQAWAAAAPAIRREVSLTGDQLQVIACDPGPTTPVPLQGSPTEALFVPRAVMEISVALHAEGMAYGQARCVGMAFVSQYTVLELSSTLGAGELTADQQAVRDQRPAAAHTKC